jgi:two-component system response regulator NreC
MSIRILLADDHQMVREGLRSLLDQVPDFAVVAEAADGLTAVQLAAEVAPQVVVMDIGLPHLNGIEATQRLLAHDHAVKVVALSIHVSREAVTNMLRAGASGYVMKECAFKELEWAIRTVYAGHAYLSPLITDVILHDYLPRLDTVEPPNLPALTPREREVVQLLAEGQAAKEIALVLGINPKTVDRHRHGAMEKLGLRNQAELIKYAMSHGIIR